MVTPPLLHPGSTVALLSPASAIDAALIDGAAEALRAEALRTAGDARGQRARRLIFRPCRPKVI